MRISVVIPAFNNAALTQRCVAALTATTDPAILAETVVVDDASTDGVSAAWTAARPGITPVLLERNRGFAGACNAGAARCTGDAILFLNNDAFAHAGALAALRGALAGDATIGVAGARLLYADGSLQHAGMALLPGGVSAWWHVYKHQPGTLADAAFPRDYLAVTGAALLIRRELFERLDGFDEGFENGWEDIDLCLRAWCAGMRVRYEPAAVFDHLESATVGRRDSHEHNERRFAERWSTLLAAAPRYPLPAVPPVALAVRTGSHAPRAASAAALAHAQTWWRRYLGAAVACTRAGSRLGRARVDVRAALDRRLPTLEIAWDDACLVRATGRRRIALVAPRTPALARAFARARDVDAWWTPTPSARDALIAGGADPGRIAITPLGAATAVPPAQRTGPPVVAVTAADAELAAALARCRPNLRTLVVEPGAPRTPEVLSAVDVVAVAAAADPWGLLPATAVCAGSRVVATPEAAAGIAGAGIDSVAAADFFDTLVARIDAVAGLRAQAPALALEARRRLGVALATEHLAELARAATGGLPPAEQAAVGAAFAAQLRGARYATATVRAS